MVCLVFSLVALVGSIQQIVVAWGETQPSCSTWGRMDIAAVGNTGEHGRAGTATGSAQLACSRHRLRFRSVGSMVPCRYLLLLMCLRSIVGSSRLCASLPTAACQAWSCWPDATPARQPKAQQPICMPRGLHATLESYFPLHQLVPRAPAALKYVGRIAVRRAAATLMPLIFLAS